jgi:hypothetical protein
VEKNHGWIMHGRRDLSAVNLRGKCSGNRFEENGASEGIRTLDTHVGNVMLYQAELRSLPKAGANLEELSAFASPVFCRWHFLCPSGGAARRDPWFFIRTVVALFWREITMSCFSQLPKAGGRDSLLHF